MPTRRINEQLYYFETHGDGPPLCMLHGFSGSSRNWTTLLPTLTSKYSVVLVDLLGHGRSASPPDPQRYVMEKVAADLYDLLAAISTLPVHLLGYSMGGRLALYHALYYPDQVQTLILESSSPGLTARVERDERRQRDEALADWISANSISAFVDRWERLPLWASQKTLPARQRDGLRKQRLKNNPVGLANSLRGMGTGAQPSLWPLISQLDRPLQLIVGELDTKFLRINKKMAAHLPAARLEIVPRAGHTVHWERPSLFSEIVLSFLALP